MNLITFLKSNESSRKIFGKSELKIIEKQLLGISLSQSEKNRLSRDIRKKLEFIEKITQFKEMFRLKKGAMIKEMVQEAKEIILDDDISGRIEEILLYGSAARNQLTFRSDIDISVRFSSILGKEALLFRKRVLGKAPEKLDIQVYNLLPEKVRRNINKEGILLYKK